jgi:hypothetical protein
MKTIIINFPKFAFLTKTPGFSSSRSNPKSRLKVDPIKWISSICIILFSLPALAQRVEIDTTTEEMDNTLYNKMIKRYEEVVRIEQEELRLVKLDLLGPVAYALSGVEDEQHNLFTLGYEQKIKANVSGLGQVNVKANKKEVTELNFMAATRYYYNMNKRIAQGKSANNFSANYLSGRLSSRHDIVYSDTQVSIDILFGIQRRLGKYAYIDFDVGFENVLVPYSGEKIGIDLTSSVQLGIAF